jgi:hypothetical protein
MDLHTWLDGDKGRATWLAEQLGRSKTAVSLWRNEGVPLALIPRIAELIGGAVTVEAMLMHAMLCKTSEQEVKAA